MTDKILKIGDKVTKKSRKPFKSSLKVNTIKGYQMHPTTNKICYTFDEDDSYVEAFRCMLKDNDG